MPHDLDHHGRAGGFPGFGEDATLDLSTLPASAGLGMVARLVDGTFDAWSTTAAAVDHCAHPVRLTGSSVKIETATGEVTSSFSSADAPLGVLYRPCGNRRVEVCPACSRTYARDTFAMIRAGIAGGKTIPETVAENPLLFVTFTAPSFGPVPRPTAGQPTGGRCRPRDRDKVCLHKRPIGCPAVHDQDDAVNGAPLCWDCYDWESALIWQWWAPELWRRTTIAVRRALATSLGVPESQLREVASVQYAKVAEYQARGLIHFHALIRLDGAHGPGSPAPIEGSTLAGLVQQAARTVEYLAPAVDGDDTARLLAWGRQLDVRVVRAGHRPDDPDAPLTAAQVAGYLAKYATKDAASLRAPGQSRPHLSRIAATCHRLADRARAAAVEKDAEHQGDAEAPTGEPLPYRLLGMWAHMLGFRGHFSTKSRRYSVTLGALRLARHRFQILAADARRAGQVLDIRDLEARLLGDAEDDTTLVIGSWAYQAPAGPCPATKPWRWLLPAELASTTSGRRLSFARHDSRQDTGRTRKRGGG